MTSLINDDLKPTTEAQRTWRWYHFTALWIGMVMCIPAYTLAASLIESGMSWSQAVGTVFLGNAIVLVPMLLIGHAGAKYGIQTWFGGMMIHTLIGVLMGQPLGGDKLPVLGISLSQLICFLGFWAIQFWYVLHGIESIRKLETWTAPIKIVICFVLLWWAHDRAGGFGPIIDQPSQFVEGGKKAGQFAAVFWPSLTAMVGFWATLALNIPDFTRFARSQRDQVLGQSIGLPLPMGLLAMLHRKHRVLVPPDDQDAAALHEVELVECRNALARGAHDAAEGGEEGGAAILLAKPRHGLQGMRTESMRSDAKPAELAPDPCGAA